MDAERRTRLLRATILVARILLGGVFIYAAYTKLSQSWTLFAMAINAYGLLPDWAVNFLAKALPWFELVLGLLLVFGVWLRASATVATALLVGFFTIMAHSYATTPPGETISCGCFGFGEPISPETLLRDGALTLIALGVTVAAFLQSRNSKLENRSSVLA